jgi:deazaflavin-dependent oxidoreductase (nitroreductase family)
MVAETVIMPAIRTNTRRAYIRPRDPVPATGVKSLPYSAHMIHGEGTYVPSTSEWVRNQVETYERSGGTEANTLGDTGIPVIIVTMRGATSGYVRKIALMRVEHEGSYALVASKGGAPDDPDWVRNLDAHPDEVLVQDGPTPMPVRVRRVDGAEKATWWARAVSVFPRYDEYQAATKRDIPVFVTSPR